MAIPIPRDPDVDLRDVPRHWLAGNAAATAISNGLNMLFPAGERFFVRSVNHYVDRIEDPTLREQLLMGARFAQLPVVQHQDLVHILDRRQPVRDRDRRAPGHQCP